MNSDRLNERHWHTIVAMLIAAMGLTVSAWLGPNVWSLVAVSIAAIGLYAQAVCFFSIPPLVLSSAAAATGFAVINAVGNLGEFLGPYVVGATVRGHGDFSLGLYAMAGAAAISALLSYMLMRFRWDHTPARSAP